MNIENKESIPAWAFSGGYIRFGFSTNDVPTKWTKRNGKWNRQELVPFGKATNEYRAKYYLCPKCNNPLELSETPYCFECADCDSVFRFSFGGLGETLKDLGRFELDDSFV